MKIFVTGGTGSFGRAFIKHTQGRADVVVYSRDELKQSQLKAEYDIQTFLGDVRDYERLNKALKCKPDLIIHAAALKRVEFSEADPDEFIKTNILGSMNVRDAAIENDIPLTIGLSSDKACQPVNLYGATKLAMERAFIAGNHYAAHGKSRFSCVRYGNVMGSRGSLHDLLKNAPRDSQFTVYEVAGNPMTRFWLEMWTAIDLVEFAMNNALGGEIIIPYGVKSGTIEDTVKFERPDLDVVYKEARPGEKRHECLMSELEAERATVAGDYGEYLVIAPEQKSWGGKVFEGDRPYLGGAYESNGGDGCLC